MRGWTLQNCLLPKSFDSRLQSLPRSVPFVLEIVRNAQFYGNIGIQLQIQQQYQFQHLEGSSGVIAKRRNMCSILFSPSLGAIFRPYYFLMLQDFFSGPTGKADLRDAVAVAVAPAVGVVDVAVTAAGP